MGSSGFQKPKPQSPLTFHNDPKIKEKYVKRMECHIKHDELISGTYWDGKRGCHVGCIVETSKNPHTQMQKELGTPLWYNKLVDRIHEQLPKEKQPWFALASLQAMPVGSDLTQTFFKLMEWLLKESRQHIKPKYTKSLDAVNGVIDLFIQAQTRKVSIDEWRKVRAAADAAYATAAYAATAAADVDAYTADAAHAAAAAAYAAATAAADVDAYAAADAAYTDAYAAATAAYADAYTADAAAARSNFYVKIADKLVELLYVA